MRTIILAGVLVLLAGCAWLQQKQADVALSNATPLTNSETQTTQQQAAAIGNTVSSLPIPFAPIAGTVVTAIAGWFLAANRGAAIRKSGTVPAKTTTNVNIWTGIVQDIANVAAGAYTTWTGTASTTSSVLQRVYKTALTTVVAGIATAVTIPSVGTFLTGHPVIDTIFVAVSSALAGLEKGLSNVPVVASVSSGSSATTTTTVTTA